MSWLTILKILLWLILAGGAGAYVAMDAGRDQAKWLAMPEVNVGTLQDVRLIGGGPFAPYQSQVITSESMFVIRGQLSGKIGSPVRQKGRLLLVEDSDGTIRVCFPAP